MIEIVLVAVITLLCGLLGWQEYQNRKERAKMLNLLVAKNNQEAINLTLADQTKIEPPKPDKTLQDIVDVNEASDDEFESMIKDQING